MRSGPSTDAAIPRVDALRAEAVFIVGTGRSGTTLMREILNDHSLIAIAAENHYLGHPLWRGGARGYLRRAGDLATDAAIHRLVTLLYAGDLQRVTWLRDPSPFWRWLARSVPRDALEARLLRGERSERGVFSALLASYAEAQGKSIIGEKTPAHIRYADTLLDWYPRARIIHMVRDPRGVYVSELRRRTEHATSVPFRWLVHVPPLMRAFILLEVAWAWADAVAHHRELSRRHGSAYKVVRFEDLVRQPEHVIGAVCEFLGVEPEPAMLERKVTSKGLRLGQVGFDADAADRWRTSIRPAEERALRWLLGRRLSAFDYPAE